MHSVRQSAIAVASSARRWGLILGTLGRQGNTNILDRLETILKEKQLPYVIVLLSEIFPDKLAKFTEVEASVALLSHSFASAA
jgi:2-(3-amino-3-carboxypropyl)histidine synthase